VSRRFNKELWVGVAVGVQRSSRRQKLAPEAIKERSVFSERRAVAGKRGRACAIVVR
jgi:hypothetical protein